MGLPKPLRAASDAMTGSGIAAPSPDQPVNAGVLRLVSPLREDSDDIVGIACSFLPERESSSLVLMGWYTGPFGAADLDLAYSP